MAEYEPRNFIQPCLLLLLRERSDHGYDLIDRLRELHAVDGEAGVVYRTLRGLEKAGMVRSSWEASDAGPARRTYRLTTLGVATLDRQADILEQTHRALHLFRRRYEDLVGAATGAGTNGSGSTGSGVAGSGVAGSGTNGSGVHGSGTNCSGVHGSGKTRPRPSAVPGGGPPRNGRNGHVSGTVGADAVDPGERGVRPPGAPRRRPGG